MTFKEFKKQNNLNPTSGFCLSFDYDIYCDMAEKAGYESDGSMEDYYGGHRDYLESYDIDLLRENIFIQDNNFTKVEQLSNEAFLREYFFDNYEIADSYNDDEYGLVIKLIH